jgi:hypothetical protein
MLECKYYNKKDLPNFKGLVVQLDHHDTKKIAAKMSRHVYMVKKYMSLEKKNASVRVPEDFITYATEIVRERKENHQKANEILKNI